MRVWLPLTISAVVTSIGFGSLMANRINAIRDFGGFAVVGILCVTITSLTLLPAVLRLLPLEQRSERSGRVAPMLATTLRRLGHWVYSRQRPLLIVSALIALVALVGATRIRVDSDFLYYFGRSSEVRSPRSDQPAHHRHEPVLRHHRQRTPASCGGGRC
jgi:predicted RND superfamily exporter protein